MPKGVFIRTKPSWRKGIDNRIFYLCSVCNQKFKDYLSNRKSSKKIYCSKKCMGVAYKGRKHTEETKRKISEINKGEKHPFYGKKHSEETKKKMRQVKLKNPTRYWLGKKISPEHNRKLQEGKSKTEHPSNWKGGINPINDTIRKSIEMRLWRESVFARDNWTCQKCKIKGGKLHPHHIKPFAYYSDLRFAINNGMTFCKNCHKEFHKKYGIKNNIKELIAEFIRL